MASINELAVGPGAQVHAVSSISRTVAVLAPLDPRDEHAGVVRILDADDARLYAARGARLEGLVLDPQAGNFVAVDHHDLDLDALFRVELDDAGPGLGAHSHSMVPGGLLVTSSTTRLTSATSLVMREEIRASTSYGTRVQSAVIASSEETGRRTIGWP